jgi:hypothetical protein
MPKANYSPAIEGLKELQEALDSKRIKKGIALGLNRFTKEFHSAISFEVTKRYNVKSNALDSVLEKNPSSSVEFGKSIIRNSLTYKYKPKDLSKYPYTIRWGNLYQPKLKQGWIHTVEVVRGRKKVVYGNHKYGGFTPRSGGKLVRKAYGGQMLERVGKERKPLKLLLGPSLSELAAMVVKNNNGKIGQTLNNLESYIIEDLYDIWAK